MWKKYKESEGKNRLDTNHIIIFVVLEKINK